MADEMKHEFEFEGRLKKGFSEVKGRLKQIEKWVPEPIAAAVTGAVKGAVVSVFFDICFMHNTSTLQFPLTSAEQEYLSSFGKYQPVIQTLILESGWERARNLAFAGGASSGILCAMKKLRGKEDVLARMAAAFGCMTTMSLVMGLRGPEVISFGAMFALWSGGMFKVCEKLSKVKADDVSYDKTRDKFSCIGLGIDHHGMNFNTGFFTSNALALLTDHRKEAKNGGKWKWFR